MRVVSLLPSATEIVCALGAGAELVGISHECDFPESVRGLPVLTRARIDASGTSKAIDDAVRAVVVGDALSIYSVDERRLAELAPDVIVTQDLCEVCAVSLDDVRAAVARLANRDHVEIVSLRPTRLGDVWNDVETVANGLGRAAQGVVVRRALEERTQEIARRARGAGRRPRVVTVEWLDPIMLGGTWMPELIELAGGEPVGARAGEPAPTVTHAELEALRPDVVLVKPCGFPVERTMEEVPLVEGIARAAAEATVYVSDGNAFFNRPGPRMVESLEILAACVDPVGFAELREKHAGVIRPITGRTPTYA
jgi:iron complex transport system substrate-binding protein